MKMNALPFLLLTAMLLQLAPAHAAEPWHLTDWQNRAVVEIGKPSAQPGCDTAAVKILSQGGSRADGRDYRVLDADGKPVPFQLTFHDAASYSLVSFRATATKRPFFVYFGNPAASRADQQVIVDESPGAGQPRGAWIPRCGLVYKTVNRPKGENPLTPEEFGRMLAASPRPHGARYQQQIADGYNPFGFSDYYMSVYRGWMYIPADGEYSFCTVSNEGSFSFLDGKPLVHWPGRHTVERGKHGEFHASLHLSAGPHYVEYYQEEVLLEQMAFLGWSPPGFEKYNNYMQFTAMPASVFPLPHSAEAVRYETPAGPLPRLEPEIVDSIWPIARHEGQYTRVARASSMQRNFQRVPSSTGSLATGFRPMAPKPVTFTWH